MKKVFIVATFLLFSYQASAQIGYLYVQPPIVVQQAPPDAFQEGLKNGLAFGKSLREREAFKQQQALLQQEQQNMQLQNELLRQQIEANNKALAKEK